MQRAIICCGYVSRFENKYVKNTRHLLFATGKQKIVKNPLHLLLDNKIGPPSVVMVHKSVSAKYDERLKWRVDCDYYTRIIAEEGGFEYIPEPLVYIGMSESQVTNTCLIEPSVELPEGFILLQKHGSVHLRDIRIYDAWWRLHRNMQIFKMEQLHQFVDQPWPKIIYRLVDDLHRAPGGISRNGLISKIWMFFSFLRNRNLASRL